MQIQEAGKEGLGLGTWGNRRPAQLEGHEGSGGGVGESSETKKEKGKKSKMAV